MRVFVAMLLLNRWFVLGLRLSSQLALSEGNIVGCKTSPGTASWPSVAEWQSLNHSLHGALLKPPPPAGACHLGQATFDPGQCVIVAASWTNYTFHAENPVSTDWNNWNNDSCLPNPLDPCSGAGYPVYVVNASSAEDVAKGISFARTHNIRLNVKGSGHDYLGRSVAPNSLSIWTKHIRGITFHDAFKPQQCISCSASSAMTLGAGEAWGDIYTAAHQQNVTFVGGTGDTIGLGGYLTGGGHSPLSAFYGMAADQVLEMQVVLASGEVVIANEKGNTDLFWAMRGGGGATFGVMTSVTLKTFPELPVATVTLSVVSFLNTSDYWDAMAYLVSQFPNVQDKGMMGYTYVANSIPINGSTISAFYGLFVMPNGTTTQASSAVQYIVDHIKQEWPTMIVQSSPTQFPSLYEWYETNKNTAAVGTDVAVGSRLLSGKALGQGHSAIRTLLETSIPAGSAANLNLVAGPGTWHARPAGGSDAVNPAWRKAYLHYIVPVSWTALNRQQKQQATSALTNVYVKALRDFAPDSGCYVNEADVNEPDFQQAFWGTNYPRLHGIKRRLDPTDLFWCAACVGNERWVVRGDVLCPA